MYQTLAQFLEKFFSPATIFKHGFNLSPMYKRSTGKIVSVSKDLHQVHVVIPLSYKNKNYVGSIFGGSLFAATDPIYMIQLMQILGKNYVVWDKAAHIQFIKPARENAFAYFDFSPAEIQDIKMEVAQNGFVNYEKQLNITNTTGTVFAKLSKTIYISSKEHYKNRLKEKEAQSSL